MEIKKCDSLPFCMKLFKYLTIYYRIFLNKEKAQDDCYRPGLLYDPYGIRTRVTAVKGRCLNHLTNGPLCMAEKEGFEPSRRLRDLHP